MKENKSDPSRQKLIDAEIYPSYISGFRSGDYENVEDYKTAAEQAGDDEMMAEYEFLKANYDGWKEGVRQKLTSAHGSFLTFVKGEAKSKLDLDTTTWNDFITNYATYLKVYGEFINAAKAVAKGAEILGEKRISDTLEEFDQDITAKHNSYNELKD